MSWRASPSLPSKMSLALGQIKVDDKSNEITAIPKLLEILEIEGAIVNIDAMGCQKEIAKRITENRADYLLALKGNQSTLKEQVLGAFESIPVYWQDQHITKGYGRIETRKCTVIRDLGLIEESENWPLLNSIIKIESTVEHIIAEKTTQETRYYISSLKADAERFNQLIRGHWGVKNSLHWTLDVTFSEDNSRTRKGHADENFSTIRRIILSILKLNDTKGCLSVKRKRQGLTTDLEKN